MNEPHRQNPPVVTEMAPVEDEGLDIGKYLGILRRRWLLILFSVVFVVGLTAFMTLRMTKIYRATTTVRIETQAPKVLGRSVEAVNELGEGSIYTTDYYKTQYQIIESRDVASRVVSEYKLNEDPDFLAIPKELRGEFKPITVEEAAEILKEMLTVEPVRDSRLVLIHIDNPDPKRAQTLSNAIAKAYVDKNLEAMLQSTVDAVDWLSEQLDDAHQKLSDSEQAVYDYMKTNDILSISLEERQNIITAQMTAIATKLSEAKARRIELQARKLAIANLVRSDNPMDIPLDDLNTNPLIQQLKQEHGRLSREYGELSSRYGPKFPRMQELEAKITRIDKDIEREVKNVLQAVNAELDTSKKTETGLKAALNNLRNQAQALSEKSVDHSRLVREKENNEKVYSLLLGRTQEADLSRLLRVNNVQILDPALLPSFPIKPRLRVNLTISALAGLLLGLVIALLVEFSDRTIKTQEDVEALGLPFLGVLPTFDASHVNSYTYGRRRRGKAPPRAAGRGPNPDLFVEEYPTSLVAESCRSIRTNLLFMSADDPVKRILITSPSPQEGKTSVAANLASVMARAGARVLLVDTDMRRPTIHRVFHQSPRMGLASYLIGESTLEESVLSTPVENLDILVCGAIPPNPAELILSKRFRTMVDEFSQRYDHVIFDSPPVGAVTDAAVLSKLVDGTLIVLKSHSTSRDAAKHAASVLRDIDANILGGVLNHLDLSKRKYGRYYRSYYYRRRGDDVDDDSSSASRRSNASPDDGGDQPPLNG